MNPMKIFALAQKTVDTLPESCGRAVFAAVGTVAGVLPLTGTKQLRKNQARFRPGLSAFGAIHLSAKAMRSYMRYYYETFRLPSLTNEQILARVRRVDTEAIRAELATGKAVTGALTHSGNWDLAGAWSNLDLAPVHTIAEKLEPPELFEGFLAFREGLGMTIYPLIKGGGALHSLERDMAEAPIFTPVLADRDLSASGIEVNFAGESVMVAPGPALLAQRTGATIYPTAVFYERITGARKKIAGTSWGIVVQIGPGVTATTTADSSPEERAADLRRMSQEWLDHLSVHVTAHLEDWHMLQKVFVADLDPDRLARARARAAEALQHPHNDGTAP